jgi:murein DD-endopeptidase MepM/ murein hydrolase activator NlpD
MKPLYSTRLSILKLAIAVGTVTLSQAALAAPNFQMPFPCGQQWVGATYSGHSPQNSVDFNRTNDYGDAVLASAAGKVVTVRNLGSSSYGLYVVVDHGGGWTSLYAHLSGVNVSVGQSISQGQRVGAVGNSGGSTGAHLHFEQRYNGYAQRIKFNGSGIYYWGKRTYSSKNACSATTSTATGTIKTSGAALNIRSGPSTNYPIVGTVSNGARVTIYCQTSGQTITGTYGTTSLWDKIGTGKFVSDAYVYTGSDGRVAPNCP